MGAERRLGRCDGASRRAGREPALAPHQNATIAAHASPFRWLTPNLDLTVQFHDFAPEAEWILSDGIVPLARDGLVGCTSRLWTEDGRLLASGTSNHICRPNPTYEADLARTTP